MISSNIKTDLTAMYTNSLWVCMCLCVNMCVCQSLSLVRLCDPIDCSPPASPVHGILQARILEWVVIPFSRGSSLPRNWNQISCIGGRFFTFWDTKEALCEYMCIGNLSICSSCSVLSDSLQPFGLKPTMGSFVYRISEAIILEWVAIFSSRRSS